MPDYEKMYHLLFNAVTDALEALKKGGTAAASALLKAAQRQCETLYIEAPDR